MKTTTWVRFCSENLQLFIYEMWFYFHVKSFNFSEIVGGRGPNYHGIFRQRSTRSEFSSRPLSHSLAFEMAMKIKRKSIKQRLGQTRNQHGYRPWYRRNWSRGGRGGRNWNYRGRSQQNSNFNRYG